MKPAPEVAGTLEIHPAFARRLNEIMLNLTHNMLQVEGVMQEVEPNIKELIEFLHFEIDRHQNKPGPMDEERRVWIRVLRNIAYMATMHSIRESVTRLNKLIDAVDTAFKPEPHEALDELP